MMKLLKKNIKIKILYASSLFFLFTSCSSFSFVPGEKTVVEKNLTSEYFQIAKGYKDLKNYSKAKEYYEKALNDSRFHDAALYEIAVCNINLKNWDEAKKTFEILLVKDKDNQNLKMSLAYVDAKSGDLEKASAEYIDLVEQYPQNAECLKNCISVLVAKKDFKLAEKYVSLMKERFPKDESLAKFEKVLEESKESKESK